MPSTHRLAAGASLLLLVPALLGEDCGPVPPEQDAVVSTDPDAVARLEAEHGVALDMLRDYLDSGEDGTHRFRVRAGSAVFEDLEPLAAVVPGLERIVAATYEQPDTDQQAPWCGEGGELTRVELDLMQRKLLGRLEPVLASFELCRPDEDQPDEVRLEATPPLDMDYEDLTWAARVLRRAEAEAARAVGLYQADLDLERQRILGVWLGCPQGTTYQRAADAHFCAVDGVKHGPWIKGDLTETLVGQPLLVGEYRHGKQHGHWKQYDADGNLLSTTEWVAGQRLGWGGGW